MVVEAIAFNALATGKLRSRIDQDAATVRN